MDLELIIPLAIFAAIIFFVLKKKKDSAPTLGTGGDVEFKHNNNEKRVEK